MFVIKPISCSLSLRCSDTQTQICVTDVTDTQSSVFVSQRCRGESNSCWRTIGEDSESRRVSLSHRRLQRPNRDRQTTQPTQHAASSLHRRCSCSSISGWWKSVGHKQEVNSSRWQETHSNNNNNSLLTDSELSCPLNCNNFWPS